MSNILLIYNANAEVARNVSKWKRDNVHMGKFIDLMTLGEPIDVFFNTNRPYLNFLKLQIQRRVLAYSVTSAIVLSAKAYGRKSIVDLGVPNKILYELNERVVAPKHMIQRVLSEELFV